MLATIRETFGLMKTSYRVLMLDRELLVFPCPRPARSWGCLRWSWLVGSGTGTLTDAADDPYSGSSLVLVFLFLFGSTAITIFFNAGACRRRSQSVARWRPDDPLQPRGGGAASPSAVCMGVDLDHRRDLLRALRGRRGRQGALAGAIAARLGGVAWSLATFFVVPIILDEGAGPVTAIRRSASLLRETWGQQLAGGAAFGLLDSRSGRSAAGWRLRCSMCIHSSACARGCPCSCFCAES